jgi:hypothetical protein
MQRLYSKINSSLDRPIVVDWAVPKDIYKSTQRNEIKPEAVDQESEDESDEEKPKYAWYHFQSQLS